MLSASKIRLGVEDMSGEKRTSSQSIQFTCFVMPTVEVGRELSLVNDKVIDLLMITVQFFIMCLSTRSGPNLPKRSRSTDSSRNYKKVCCRSSIQCCTA